MTNAIVNALFAGLVLASVGTACFAEYKPCRPAPDHDEIGPCVGARTLIIGRMNRVNGPFEWVEADHCPWQRVCQDLLTRVVSQALGAEARCGLLCGLLPILGYILILPLAVFCTIIYIVYFYLNGPRLMRKGKKPATNAMRELQLVLPE